MYISTLSTKKTIEQSSISTHQEDDGYHPQSLVLINLLTDCSVAIIAVWQGSQPAARGPLPALGRVLCDPGRVFYKIQCVMNIDARVTRHYMTKVK